MTEEQEQWALIKSGENRRWLLIEEEPVRWLTDREAAEIALWDVELTDEEICALMNASHPTNIRPANLVAWTPPEEEVTE